MCMQSADMHAHLRMHPAGGMMRGRKAAHHIDDLNGAREEPTNMELLRTMKCDYDDGVKHEKEQKQQQQQQEPSSRQPSVSTPTDPPKTRKRADERCDVVLIDFYT